MEFLLRTGDIDNRTYSGPDTDAMLQGGRIHRKIQKSMPDTYHAEVPLKAVFEEDGLVLVLYGRADGIRRVNGAWVIEEIKWTARTLDGDFGGAPAVIEFSVLPKAVQILVP